MNWLTSVSTYKISGESNRFVSHLDSGLGRQRHASDHHGLQEARRSGPISEFKAMPVASTRGGPSNHGN